MFEEIFEEELARESVFRDVSKLSPDYVPEKMPHRENEFRELTRMFKQVIERKLSQRALITGSVGVGKTALAQRFGQEIVKASKARGLELSYFHVNCRKDKTPYAVLLAVMQHYNPRWPSRGLGPEKLLAMVVEYLDKHDAQLILALDEIDYFIKLNGSDMLYSLTRASEEQRKPNRISIIAIGRDKSFMNLLDAATQSTFLHNVLELDRYTAPQLVDILNYRVGEAFKSGVLSEEVIPLVADIAARSGDARFAIELLWRAGMIADDEASDVVLPEHVRLAKSEIYPEVRRDVLKELQLHEQLLLLALARRLKISNRAYALTGEVEQNYRIACEEYNEKFRRHTQLWGYLRRMEGLGLIDIRPAKQRGKTHKISLQDVPAKVLIKELESILSGAVVK